MLPRRKKMTFIYIGAGLIIATVALALYYFLFFSRSCNPPLPRETVAIGGASFSAEITATMAEKACGLSGRAGLGVGDGMIFPFGSPSVRSFWMKDMEFPLDIVWIGGGKVLGFAQDAPAPAPGTPLWSLKIYTSPDGTDTVLEVPAGTVAKDNIKVGDTVLIGI